MSKKTILLIIIIIGMFWFILNSSKTKDLVNPTAVPTSTPALPQAPKTFQFDSSTDLEAELEKVNPQVLDSDFNE